MTSYDYWKTTEPDAETLGDAPQSDEDRIFSEYGKPVTEYWKKPIPDRRHDWTAFWPDHDDGWPVGTGPTEMAAIGDRIAWTEVYEA